MVRALASHQCGPGLIPEGDAIVFAEFVVSSRLVGSPGTLKKLTFPNSNSIRKQWK